jgi:hypothetical protein
VPLDEVSVDELPVDELSDAEVAVEDEAVEGVVSSEDDGGGADVPLSGLVEPLPLGSGCRYATGKSLGGKAAW